MRWACLAVGIAALLLAGRVAAQPPAADARVAEARGLFEAGIAAFDAGRYDQALDYFERAYDLRPLPELLFNIGSAADRAGRIERAIGAFERYIAETPAAADRSEVEARLVSLRRRRTADQISHTPPPPAPTPTPPTEPTPVETPSRALPWVITGVSGAIAVTGAVLLAIGQSANGSVEDASDGTAWSDVSGDYDRGPTLSTAGVIMLGAGIAGVVLGVVLVTSGGDDSAPDAELGLSPAGVHVRGRF